MTRAPAPGRPRRAERVEVRESARGRELRIDGTFASYYRPGRVATRSVWDALAAPLLLLPARARRRVLILGLGGGSAARVARALAPRARIVGVEVDPEVVRLAERWFGLRELGVDVVHDDAEAFLARGGGRFDAVLDDVFVGRGRAVRKPPWIPHPGLAQMARRLRPDGILVSNTIDESAEVARALRALLPVGMRISVAGYDNQVLVASRRPLSGRALRVAVRRDPHLRGSLDALRLRSLWHLSGRRPGTAARPG